MFYNLYLIIIIIIIACIFLHWYLFFELVTVLWCEILLVDSDWKYGEGNQWAAQETANLMQQAAVKQQRQR